MNIYFTKTAFEAYTADVAAGKKLSLSVGLG